MACKAHLRNNKPLVICLSTNDALGMNLKNIGILLNTKNIYFVPFGMDDYISKPNSMTAHVDLLQDTIVKAGPTNSACNTKSTCNNNLKGPMDLFYMIFRRFL